jgi:hypothetical protein
MHVLVKVVGVSHRIVLQGAPGVVNAAMVPPPSRWGNTTNIDGPRSLFV